MNKPDTKTIIIIILLGVVGYLALYSGVPEVYVASSKQKTLEVKQKETIVDQTKEGKKKVAVKKPIKLKSGTELDAPEINKVESMILMPVEQFDGSYSKKLSVNADSIDALSPSTLVNFMDNLQNEFGGSQKAIEVKYQYTDDLESIAKDSPFNLERLECGDSVCGAILSYDYDEDLISFHDTFGFEQMQGKFDGARTISWLLGTQGFKEKYQVGVIFSHGDTTEGFFLNAPSQ